MDQLSNFISEYLKTCETRRPMKTYQWIYKHYNPRDYILGMFSCYDQYISIFDCICSSCFYYTDRHNDFIKW